MPKCNPACNSSGGMSQIGYPRYDLQYSLQYISGVISILSAIYLRCNLNTLNVSQIYLILIPLSDIGNICVSVSESVPIIV